MPAGACQKPLSGVSSSSVEEIKPILHKRKNMRDGDSKSEGFAPIKKKSKHAFSSAREESNEGSADGGDEEEVGTYDFADDFEDASGRDDVTAGVGIGKTAADGQTKMSRAKGTVKTEGEFVAPTTVVRPEPEQTGTSHKNTRNAGDGAGVDPDDGEGGKMPALVELTAAKAMLRGIVTEAKWILAAAVLSNASSSAEEFAQSGKTVHEFIAEHGPKWVEKYQDSQRRKLLIAKNCLEEVANIGKEIVRNPQLGPELQGAFSSIADVVKAAHDDDAYQAMSDALSAARSAKNRLIRREQASAADEKSFAGIDGVKEVAGKPSGENAISDSKMRDA